MTTLKAVNAVEKTVKKILSDRVTETADLTEQVKKEAAAIAKFSEAMEAATTAGDVKAYQRAKADRRDAADAKEMYEARLNALNNKPLISKADYEKAVADIYAEIAALEDQKKQQLAKLSDQMETEALELQEATEKANAVLRRLQKEVYRDADRSRNAKGDIMTLSHEDKAVNKWATISWGKVGVTSHQYAEYTGRKVKQEGGRLWN